MSTALGLIGLLIYIACVVALAAFVTWLVVKLLPIKETAKPSDAQSSP